MLYIRLRHNKRALFYNELIKEICLRVRRTSLFRVGKTRR